MDYHYYAYDHQGRLRFSGGIWLSLLFLLHPYLVVVMSFANFKDRTGLIQLLYPDQSWLALSALASLPALLVLMAWVKWQKQQQSRLLFFWRNGKLALRLSSAVYLGNIGLLWVKSHGSYALVIQSCCAIFTAYYLFVSPRVSDVFRQPITLENKQP